MGRARQVRGEAGDTHSWPPGLSEPKSQSLGYSWQTQRRHGSTPAIRVALKMKTLFYQTTRDRSSGEGDGAGTQACRGQRLSPTLGPPQLFPGCALWPLWGAKSFQTPISPSISSSLYILYLQGPGEA